MFCIKKVSTGVALRTVLLKNKKWTEQSSAEEIESKTDLTDKWLSYVGKNQDTITKARITS